MIALIVLFVVLNFAISYWNAYVVGSCWYAVQKEGSWWHKTIIYSALFQSAAGFTWCYSMVLSGLLFLFASPEGKVTPETAMAVFQLFQSLIYVILVPGLLLSGLAITVHSWMEAIKRRDLLSGGIAAWNTFAQISNTISFFRHIGPIFESIGKTIREQGSKNVILAAICLVILALLGGVYTTYKLVTKYAAASLRSPQQKSMEY